MFDWDEANLAHIARHVLRNRKRSRHFLLLPST